MGRMNQRNSFAPSATADGAMDTETIPWSQHTFLGLVKVRLLDFF